MPILPDNSNVTIEFSWGSDDTDLVLQVKYHVVDSVPSVSYSQDGNDWYSLPYSFFKEVITHIDQQRGFVRQSMPQKKPSFKTSVAPTGKEGQVAITIEEDRPQSGLPMPIIQRTMDENGTLEPLEVANITPLENFTGLEALTARATLPGPQSAKKKRQNQAQEEVISRPVIRGADEETSAMLRGGGNASRSIKPRHQV